MLTEYGNQEDADTCDCGSGMATQFNMMTKGFDCSECSASVVVHEACGSAFYTWDGETVCDECGKAGE